MTTTKFTSGPTSYENAYLTATSTPTISLDQGSTAFNFKSLKAYVIGQADASKAPNKAISDWWAANSAAINAASLQKSLQVSGWAIVVDLEWTTEFKTPVAAAPTDGTKLNVQATQASPYAQTSQQVGTVFPTANTFGDSISVFFVVDKQTYVPAAIRVGRKVTTQAVCTATAGTVTGSCSKDQVDAFVAESWSYSAFTVSSYSDNTKNLGINPAFSEQKTCDTARWENNGCNGIAIPWAFGTQTAATASATGKIRAWHFLADAAADKASIFSLEKGDLLRVLVHDLQVPKIASFASATFTPRAYETVVAIDNQTRVGWVVKEVTLTNAVSTIVGATAIVSGLIVSMF